MEQKTKSQKTEGKKHWRKKDGVWRENIVKKYIFLRQDDELQKSIKGKKI